MLRKLPIGLVITAVLAIALNLQAKGPDEAKPLRERFFITNSVGSTLILLETDLVQKEVALTGTQKARIVPLTKEMGESYDKIFNDNPDAPSLKPNDKVDSADKSEDSNKSTTNLDGSISITLTATPKNPERDRKIEQATKDVDQKVQKQLDEIDFCPVNSIEFGKSSFSQRASFNREVS